MNKGFEILDGKLFVEKGLFREAQQTCNNISVLTGSSLDQMFKNSPEIHTGIESVIIDYHNSVSIAVPKDVNQFITEITGDYQNRVRGSIKISSDNRVFDIVLSNY